VHPTSSPKPYAINWNELVTLNTPLFNMASQNYYCCYCGHGPWNLRLDTHCHGCGHQRCSGCKGETGK
ncbi:hypothetical protein F4860DRAFT_416726, partial [Xylaria cubensis]